VPGCRVTVFFAYQLSHKTHRHHNSVIKIPSSHNAFSLLLNNPYYHHCLPPLHGPVYQLLCLPYQTGFCNGIAHYHYIGTIIIICLLQVSAILYFCRLKSSEIFCNANIATPFTISFSILHVAAINDISYIRSCLYFFLNSSISW